MNQTATQRLEAREFSIPAGARRVTCKQSGALAALFSFGPKAAAKGFKKGAAKPSFFYTFPSEQSRDLYVAEWLRGQAQRAATMAERKAKRAAFAHTLEVGAILVSSWGYDQTNVDFYQVIEVLGKKAIVIREIEASQISSDEQTMGGRVVAKKDAFCGEPMRKIVGEGNSIKIESFASAHPWDGRPRHYCHSH